MHFETNHIENSTTHSHTQPERWAVHTLHCSAYTLTCSSHIVYTYVNACHLYYNMYCNLGVLHEHWWMNWSMLLTVLNSLPLLDIVWSFWPYYIHMLWCIICYCVCVLVEQLWSAGSDDKSASEAPQSSWGRSGQPAPGQAGQVTDSWIWLCQHQTFPSSHWRWPAYLQAKVHFTIGTLNTAYSSYSAPRRNSVPLCTYHSYVSRTP